MADGAFQWESRTGQFVAIGRVAAVTLCFECNGVGHGQNLLTILEERVEVEFIGDDETQLEILLGALTCPGMALYMYS
jgi:hypothetical protein